MAAISSQKLLQPRPGILYLLALLSLVTTPAFSQLEPTATITINLDPGYAGQRPCGRGCLQNTYNNGPDLEAYLRCSNNGCFCAETNRGIATASISACWLEVCQGSTELPVASADIASALFVYDGYCGFISTASSTDAIATGGSISGFISASSTPAPASRTLATIVSTSASSAEPPDATTADPSTTEDVTRSNPRGGNNALGTGALIAAIIAPILTTIGLMVTLYMCYREKKKSRDAKMKREGQIDAFIAARSPSETS